MSGSRSGPTQSVYEQIVARVPTDGSPGLTEEPRGHLSWAYGRTVRSARVLELVEAARDPALFSRAHQELCAFLAGMDSTPLELDELEQLPSAGPRADLPLARALTYRGQEVEVVKVGIALMSLGHEPEDRARLLTIARDDQYTRNVFWTLTATKPGPSHDLLAWEIARVAYGPGRQWALGLISDDPPRGYKRWLVCEGFRTYRDDYGPLAPVAIKGDLAGQLARASGTDTQLAGAAFTIMRRIFEDSWNDGAPAEAHAYPDIAKAARHLFPLLAQNEPRFGYLQLAEAVRNWFLSGGGYGLPEADVAAAIHAAEKVFTWADWSDYSRWTLERDDANFYVAEEILRARGNDTFPYLLAKACRGSGEGENVGAWVLATKYAGPERIDEVLGWAEKRLIGDQGLKPAAAFVVEALVAYPGHGWPLLKAALRSRSPLEYIPALRVLGSWDTGDWPDDTAMVLTQMLDRQLELGADDVVRSLLDQV